uniref:Uncharacterized protein n=1 Tax=Arundo donax TaxID=35708 RepID=A0A0A9GTW6_ARUDO
MPIFLFFIIILVLSCAIKEVCFVIGYERKNRGAQSLAHLSHFQFWICEFVGCLS